ncbi:MAG: SRPBCC family protein [Ktedonobacterales bacterium]|nr:SRPBCC family protein [Ktedonobacterales bacterium]
MALGPSSVLVPASLAMAGFAVGAIVGGGRLVRTYDWETEWRIAAPRAEVFRILTTPEEQYHWWPSMRVVRAAPLPGNPDGRIITYAVRQASSVARLAPPFRIRTITGESESERRIRTVVSGDLVGVLETLLADWPDDGGTRVVFHWYVRVRNPILNLFGFVAEPMFRASHDHVMREGEAGLQRYCAERLAAVKRER